MLILYLNKYMINRINKIFAIIVIFLIFSFIILLFTHNELKINNINNIKKEIKKGENISLINSKDYALYIKPILFSVIEDSSSENIILARDQIFNYSNFNRYLGSAHTNLFLAFETWEDYLTSPDEYLKRNILEKLNIVLNIVPELKNEINELKKILK